MAATLRLLTDASGMLAGAQQAEQAAGRIVRATSAIGVGASKAEAEFESFRREMAEAGAAARAGVTHYNAHQRALRDVETQTNKATTAQKALGKALDVSGNLARGFFTGLAIAPVVALGAALADSAKSLLGFGEAAKTASEDFQKLLDKIGSARSDFFTGKQFPGTGLGMTDLEAARTRLRLLEEAQTNAAGFDADAKLAPQFRGALYDLGVVLPVGAPNYEVMARISEVQRETADLIRTLTAREEISKWRPGVAPTPSGMPFNTFPGVGGIPSGVMQRWGADLARSYGDPWGGLSQSPGSEFGAALAGLDVPQDQFRLWLNANRPSSASFIGDIGDPARTAQNALSRVRERQAAELDALNESEERAQALGDSITGALDRGIATAQNFGDVLQSVFLSLMQQLLHESVTAPAGQAIAGWLTTGASVAAGAPPIPPGVAPAMAGGGGSGFTGKGFGGGRTTVVVNQYISTPDVGGFRRSQRQNADDARRAFMGR